MPRTTKTEQTIYSPETEARMRPFEQSRARQITRITELWTQLRRKQNLDFSLRALNEKINRDWQLLYGLDSLGGEYLNRLEKTLIERNT